MCDESQIRCIASEEAALLDTLLATSFPGSETLRHQIENCNVSVLHDGASLQLTPVIGSKADVQCRVPVEATTVDNDGVTIHILLHVVNGFLNELEVYKEDLSPCRTSILGKQIKVSVMHDAF